MSKQIEQIALEFPDDDQFMAGLGLLEELGDWVLPGRLTIIINPRDLGIFKGAGLQFKKLPVVSTADLSPEERSRVRAEMWPHMRAKTGA